MGLRLTPLADPLLANIRTCIQNQLPDASIEVDGGGGHYTIAVTSATFVDKTTLERQRLVYSAIAPLMKGDNAPLHAVDRLMTNVP